MGSGPPSDHGGRGFIGGPDIGAFSELGASPPVGTVVTLTATAGAGADQAASINAQIAAAPHGTPDAWTYIRFPTGEATATYQVDTTILLASKRYVVLEGPSNADKARLERTDDDNDVRHIEVRDCLRTLVRWVHVTGTAERADAPNGDYAKLTIPGTNETEVAFTITGGANCEFADCAATDVRSYLTLAFPSGVTPTTYSAFRRIDGLRVGGWGFAGIHCEHIDVDDITFEKSAFGAADFEPNSSDEVVRHVRLRRWTVDTYGFGFIKHQNYEVTDILIEDVTVLAVNKDWPIVNAANEQETGIEPCERWTVRRLTFPGMDGEWGEIGGGWGCVFGFQRASDITVVDCDVQASWAAGLDDPAIVGLFDPPESGDSGVLTVTGNDGTQASASVVLVRSPNPTSQVVSGNRWGSTLQFSD